MIIKYCFLQCSFRCFWMPSQFCMIILVEGFYLHVSVRLLVQCMGSNFFSFLKCNITEWWKKYFFVTKVVPLLTFGLLSIALFLLLFLFFQLFSRWFGEAIHCGCKTKHLKKKKILKEEPSAGEHSAVVQECFSTSTLWDVHGHFISSWLVEGLVMALATVILDTFSYFTFHKFHLHSLYKGFLCLFLGWGRSASLWKKKVISEQYTSAVLKIYVFL